MYINQSGQFKFITVFAIAQTEISNKFPEAVKVKVAVHNHYTQNGTIEITLIKGDGKAFESVCAEYPEGKMEYIEGWPVYTIPLHSAVPKPEYHG